MAVVRSDVIIAFDEICAVVVFNEKSVQVLGFVRQTAVWVANNLHFSRPGSFRSRFVWGRIVGRLVK